MQLKERARPPGEVGLLSLPGGDAGSRTRVRNKRPQASTSVVSDCCFAGRSGSDHRTVVQLAEVLRPAYRRLRAAPYGLLRRIPTPPGPIGSAVVTRGDQFVRYPILTRPTPRRWCGRRGRRTLCQCWLLCFCSGFTRLERLGLQLTTYLPRRNRSSPYVEKYSTASCVLQTRLTWRRRVTRHPAP